MTFRFPADYLRSSSSCTDERSRVARPSIDYDGLQRLCRAQILAKWQLAEIKLTPLRKLYTRANYGQFMNILASLRLHIPHGKIVITAGASEHQ